MCGVFVFRENVGRSSTNLTVSFVKLRRMLCQNVAQKSNYAECSAEFVSCSQQACFTHGDWQCAYCKPAHSLGEGTALCLQLHGAWGSWTPSGPRQPAASSVFAALNSCLLEEIERAASREVRACANVCRGSAKLWSPVHSCIDAGCNDQRLN